MVELPEAVTISRQISKELKGKRIASAARGNSPHKFAFYNGTPEEYAAILKGKTIGKARDHGGCIMVDAEPGHVLLLGGGGQRIFLHKDETTLPKKHQLLLQFTDGTFLSVTIQGWGITQVRDASQPDATYPSLGKRVSPMTDEFTLDYFRGLFGELKEADSASVKHFVISKPGVWGVGNGYLQDILFGAGLHPKHKAIDLSAGQRRGLYNAIRATLTKAIELGGRDTELDLHGEPGGYRPILDRRAKGQPCPKCATAIEVISYLGGSCYFCPKCQT